MPRVNNDGALESYELTNRDKSGSIKYFGFVDKYGNWYILSLTGTTDKYIRGPSGTYLENWTNRVSLSYEDINLVF